MCGILRYCAEFSVFLRTFPLFRSKMEKTQKSVFEQKVPLTKRIYIYIYIRSNLDRSFFHFWSDLFTFCDFFHFGAKKAKRCAKTENSAQNGKFRTFSPFRENELKIPIKGIGFNRPWEPCAFFAFWSEKGGKVRFFAKKCDFARKSAEFQ